MLLNVLGQGAAISVTNCHSTWKKEIVTFFPHRYKTMGHRRPYLYVINKMLVSFWPQNVPQKCTSSVFSIFACSNLTWIGIILCHYPQTNKQTNKKMVQLLEYIPKWFDGEACLTRLACFFISQHLCDIYLSPRPFMKDHCKVRIICMLLYPFTFHFSVLIHV